MRMCDATQAKVSRCKLVWKNEQRKSNFIVVYWIGQHLSPIGINVAIKVKGEKNARTKKHTINSSLLNYNNQTMKLKKKTIKCY